MSETAADLIPMILEELPRLGAEPQLVAMWTRAGSVKALAEGLARQQIEWGEVGVSAACIGYMVARGARF